MSKAATREGPINSFPAWKQDIARAIHSAVYNAAIGMTDEEIQAVVKHAIIRARRDLSS